MPDKPDEESNRRATLQTLRSSLGTVQFPSTRDDVVREIGDVRVPASKDGTEVPVRDVLQAIRQNEYASADRLLDLVDDSWPHLSGRFTDA